MSFGVQKKMCDKVLDARKLILKRARFNILIGLTAILLLFIFPVNGFSKNALVMVTDKACPYCQAWEREVGKVYPKTKLAQEFPLIRVEIDERLTELSVDFNKVRGTPTFIFLRDNNEIGRIEGFSDTEMFWWLVDDIIIQIDKTKE